MGSLLQLTSAAFPFLMLLNNSVETPTLPAQNNMSINATQNAATSATPLKLPTDFSSLIAFIYSFSALHDYLKLIVLGGAFETLRRLYSSSYKSLMDRFYLTATFESDDSSFGEHPLSLIVSHRTDLGSRLGDVLALFSSSVPSVPGLFSQHWWSLHRGQRFGD
jgi:hypothetical protein